MNKGIIFCISAVLLIIFSSSCKRKHECICIVNGPDTYTTSTREFVGYSRAEADKLCTAEEFASNATTQLDCVLR